MVLERILIGLLFLTGFTGIVAIRNIIKKIFALSILNNAVVLLFVLEGSQIGEDSPILGPGIENMVDPVPQALMLTAIVIGVCVSALALALAFRLQRKTGSFDIDVIYRKIHDDPSL